MTKQQKEEFILRGSVADIEFNDRLKTFIMAFSGQNQPIISKKTKIWAVAGIITISLLVGMIWYFYGREEMPIITKTPAQDTTQTDISQEKGLKAKLNDCEALFQFLEKENVVVQILRNCLS